MPFCAPQYSDLCALYYKSPTQTTATWAGELKEEMNIFHNLFLNKKEECTNKVTIQQFNRANISPQIKYSFAQKTLVIRVILQITKVPFAPLFESGDEERKQTIQVRGDKRDQSRKINKAENLRTKTSSQKHTFIPIYKQVEGNTRLAWLYRFFSFPIHVKTSVTWQGNQVK